ncbi:MAG: thiamine pyrophosphate-dependent dehydrogenase E1 component subunit alpha [Sedimentibacter sp.]
MELRLFTEKPDPRKYDKDLLLNLYRVMLQERVFDESIVSMVYSGKVKGFYHAGAGQEAIAAGSCVQLRDDDYIFYMHRGCNEMIAKGVSIDELYADFFANVHGTNKGLGAGIIHSAYPSKGVLGQPGTIGSNASLGAGVGYAIKYRKSDQVCVCYFGDGTAARETIYGALNWIGLWKLPVIFVCENNEYGLSNHYLKANAIKEHVAEKATGFNNIDCVVVDGNNVLAMKEVTDAAIDRARKGEGGTFIEAKTFRYGGHFVGDPTIYIDKEKLAWFKNENDPINNLKKSLLESNIATESELDAVEQKVREEDKKAIEIADTYPLPERERLFEGLFSEGKEVFLCRK